MRKLGKDNSGEKIWRRVFLSSEEELSEQEKDKELLQDNHGHLIVDHDLFNHEGMTEDGIAEAFIEFAKKENLSFFNLSLSVAPFDAEKYGQLMDRLEAVEVSFSEIDLGDRFDAEYFWKENLAIEKILQQKYSVKFRVLANFVASAFYPAATQLYEFGDTPFIRCVDCINYPLITQEQNENFERIPFDFIENNAGINTIKEEDLVITKVGTPCYTSIIKYYSIVALSRTVLGVKNIRNVDNYYLLSFLRCRYGFNQLLRQRELTIQYQLTLDRVKNIYIYQPNKSFQIFIRKIVFKYLDCSSSSKDLYRQSEELLLSELNLKYWQPTEESIAVKSFSSSFLASGRLDAEYYQPKQQKIMNMMGSSGLRLGDIANLKKRKFQPSQQGIFNYIEIGNLTGEGFASSDVVDVSDTPSRAQWIVKTNDVITSTVRPIRRLSAFIEKEQNDYVCSSGFAVLKPIKVEPEVLLVYLRLPIVCEILDLHTTASMYPAISTEDLLNIPITLPDTKVCQNIAEKVKASRKAREQSKQLLEIAKIGVEKAIETDEATATAWINQQLAALGINSL
ncbi:restriction endonuclease subunit S [Trichormus sp. NMC-1]|uniref:restriction endonuclease subunit S n=1 Tax=Trichormus sp. NMC-1 TaxID=1853259 RepID=UPI001EFFD0CB|nr:restriction endonuclease subunit S [Trichormus sp. NMC-1]